MSKLFVALLLAVVALSANAFPVNQKTTTNSLTQFSSAATVRPAATALSGRKWNFNEGQAPWGLKQNAEIWNGRVAQVRVVVVTGRRKISFVPRSLTVAMIYLISPTKIHHDFSIYRWHSFGFLLKS
jgi:hypothetical protein